MSAETYETFGDLGRRGAVIDWEAFYRNYRKPGYVPGFEIVNKLGGGVFGMVFKARKESIGKDYAIKFLKVDDEAVRDAVVRELESVRFFAQVDHPNLVSIEDKGEIDGIPYILMSYAGQETLRTRLDEGPLDREEALRVFIQAARGVQALHEHSLVHFDLKPANIFLKGDIARVGDYGLSKLVTESRNSLSFGRGTPYYMAPEMLRRRGDVRSDVYSLGVILYECLTGDVPFRGDSEWEVLRKHETELPRIPETILQPERSVLERCLAKDPGDRFQTVTELLHALQAPSALGESMVIPPPSPGAARRDAPPPVAERAPARQEPPPIPAAPRSTPVAPDHEHHGVVATALRVVFQTFEFAIRLVLAPARVVAATAGRLAVFLLQLPLRLFALVLTLAGYLIVALVMLMLLVSVLSMVAG